MKTILALILMTAFCFAQTPKAGVTKANYDRIKNEMSYAQVIEILGRDGEELSSSELGGVKTVMYKWNGDKGQPLGANMNAMFQNDKLMMKAQSALK